MSRSSLALATNIVQLPNAAPSQLMSDYQWFADTLRSQNRSPQTIESYRQALDAFDRYLDGQGLIRSTVAGTRQHVQGFITDQLTRNSAGTANTRYAGLRAFFNFAVSEEIIEQTPMRGMHSPTMPTVPVPVLSIDELRRLLDTCSGKAFADRRDIPVEYRVREGKAILEELALLEATLSRDMILWRYGQGVEAARLRAADPLADPAQETRRLREQMEAASLAEQFPKKIEAQNHLLPEAWRLLNAGNVERAQMFVAAAKKNGAMDGSLDHEITRLLDTTIPHRRQAVEIEVMAQDGLELSRRDIAASRVAHKIGTPQEQARSSTAMKMADYRRQREAPVLKQELGIDLPPASE